MSQLSDFTIFDGAARGISWFLANLSLAKSHNEAFGLLASLARSFGFENLCLAIETSPANQQRWSTLGQDTETCLLAIGFDGHDPVRRFARRTSDPFIWTRDDWPGDQGPAARDIMANLRKSSIEAGMSVAVWGRAGRVATADAFAPEDRIRGLQPHVADMLFLATAQTIRAIDRLSEVQDMPTLTPREVEVLRACGAWIVCPIDCRPFADRRANRKISLQGHSPEAESAHQGRGRCALYIIEGSCR